MFSICIILYIYIEAVGAKIPMDPPYNISNAELRRVQQEFTELLKDQHVFYEHDSFSGHNFVPWIEKLGLKDVVTRVYQRYAYSDWRYCHVPFHILGYSVKTAYPDDLDWPEAVRMCYHVKECRMGCFHGFTVVFIHVEHLKWNRTGASMKRQIDATARLGPELCSEKLFPDPDDFVPCVHGVGHALFEEFGHSLDVTLEGCKHLPGEPFYQHLCFDGTWMSYWMEALPFKFDKEILKPSDIPTCRDEKYLPFNRRLCYYNAFMVQYLRKKSSGKRPESEPVMTKIKTWEFWKDECLALKDRRQNLECIFGMGGVDWWRFKYQMDTEDAALVRRVCMDTRFDISQKQHCLDGFYWAWRNSLGRWMNCSHLAEEFKTWTFCKDRASLVEVVSKYSPPSDENILEK